jgi:spore germination protein GerM
MTDPDHSRDEPVSSRSLKVWHFALIAFIAIAVVAFLYYMTEIREPGEPPPPPADVSVVPEGSRAVTLFFADVEGEGLVSETREVAIGTDYSEQLVQVVEALLNGPDRSGVSAIPAGTKLLNAFYDSEAATAYLDFSSELVAGHPGGSSAEYYTIAALMRTVSENIPEVQAVQILVEGLQVGTIGGHIDAYQPFLVRDWR